MVIEEEELKKNDWGETQFVKEMIVWSKTIYVKVSSNEAIEESFEWRFVWRV
jgi:hypothetical protein